MICTVASFKGGVGKTTTSVHLAALLHQHAPTLLIDGDANRSALGWAERGELPFKVIDERAGARFAREYEHIVIDTEAHPNEADLRALVQGCDLLIIPTTPDTLSLRALLMTVDALRTIGADSYRILLTIVPPRPSRDANEARAMLTNRNLRLFNGEISRLVAFQKATLLGVTVDRVPDPRARQGWEDYLEIGKELLA